MCAFDVNVKTNEMDLLKFYMRHTCYLKFGVSWSSVGEAKKSIYMTQSDLENTVLLEKKMIFASAK